MTRQQFALDHLVRVRQYALHLIDSIPTSEWFQMPSAGTTHVAWQVGHLAVAEYSLALERQRGKRSEDAALISTDFLEAFKRLSVPVAEPGKYPSAAEIRRVLDTVHQQALTELPALPDVVLDEVLGRSHPICRTKYDALVWCGQHEMIHVGQIGLLRRLLGHAPKW
jgi:hypothetical protein